MALADANLGIPVELQQVSLALADVLTPTLLSADVTVLSSEVESTSAAITSALATGLTSLTPDRTERSVSNQIQGMDRRLNTKVAKLTHDVQYLNNTRRIKQDLKAVRGELLTSKRQFGHLLSRIQKQLSGTK